MVDPDPATEGGQAVPVARPGSRRTSSRRPPRAGPGTRRAAHPGRRRARPRGCTPSRCPPAPAGRTPSRRCTPMPTTRASPSRSARSPASLRSPTTRSLGHFSPAPTPATSPDRLRQRHRGRHHHPVAVVGRGPDAEHRHEQRRAGRRVPARVRGGPDPRSGGRPPTTRPSGAPPRASSRRYRLVESSLGEAGGSRHRRRSEMRAGAGTAVGYGDPSPDRPRGPCFSKVLIANRGEIAVRVMRTCRELGIATVAVYSELDRDATARPVRRRGLRARRPDRGRELPQHRRHPRRAIERSGADAVHPGYGFFAENADFARAITDRGVGLDRPAARGDRDHGRQDLVPEGAAAAAGSSACPAPSIRSRASTRSSRSATRSVGRSRSRPRTAVAARA